MVLVDNPTGRGRIGADVSAADVSAADVSAAGDGGSALARLRRHVRLIERPPLAGARPPLSLGARAIDAALGGGLPPACLHAIAGSAAAGFAAVLAGRLAADAAAAGRRRVLWCLPAGDPAPLYPPGLPALGLDPAGLVVVLCRRQDEMLRVMEDALRSGGPAAVVAEVAGTVDLTASRRLQLAAGSGGVTGLLVLAGAGGPAMTGGAEPGAASPPRAAAAAAAAVRTRWRIDPLAAGPPPPGAERAPGIRWRIGLERNRGGTTGRWDVEIDGTTHRFAVVSPPGHRPAVAAAAAPAPRRAAAAGAAAG